MRSLERRASARREVVCTRPLLPTTTRSGYCAGKNNDRPGLAPPWALGKLNDGTPMFATWTEEEERLGILQNCWPNVVANRPRIRARLSVAVRPGRPRTHTISYAGPTVVLNVGDLLGWRVKQTVGLDET
jgi:hypothetical protein